MIGGFAEFTPVVAIARLGRPQSSCRGAFVVVAVAASND
jgi:hypothetical protein